VLPASWRLAADPSLQRRDQGRVLLGGTPFRVWRLNERAATVADHLLGGDPIGEDPTYQSLARRLLDAGMAHPVSTSPAAAVDEVTVVIPFLGPAEELAGTLAALGPTGPVIVVDDGCADAGAVAAAARQHGAEVVRHAANRGPGAARNTGWRLAGTEAVAFVDGGCLPGEGWLAALLAHLDDPEVAAVAPRITAELPASLPRTLAAYERDRPSLDRGPDPAAVHPRSRVPFVPSAALLVRRSDLERAGGFDEDLRWGEDVDLVWRLVGEGRTVRYEPAAVVRHVARATTRSWLRQRFDYGSSAAPLARRHDAAVRPLGTSVPVAAAWALGTGVGVVPGLLCAGATTVGLIPKLSAVPEPRREAVRLSVVGHAYGGQALAEALRRPWWPLLAVAALRSRRAQRVAALVAVVPPAVEWLCERPALDPVRWTALRLLDDAAYGAGVWAGCWRERSLRCILPAFTGGGRRRARTPPRTT